MPEAAPFNLPFDEAIQFFRAKGIQMSPDSWRDVWREANGRAFTVARVTQMDVLADVKLAVDAALSQGMSLGEFKKSVRPMLERKGWFAQKGEPVSVPVDGTMRKRLTPWRLENIYRTNLQTAYSVGRYQQQQETASFFPYLQYMAILDSRTRPSHAAMHGKVIHRDHPVWDRWYPPNGFACRCYVKSLTDRQVKARGLKVQEKGVAVNPDEGWDYNVGKAGLYEGWRPEWKKYPDATLGAIIRQSLSSSDFERFLSGEIKTDFPVAVLQEAWREAIGAKEKTVLFSSESRTKNLVNHPDLDLEDYRKIQVVIEDAQTVVQDGDQTLVFMRRDGKIYHAVVKATAGRESLYLTSFRLTSIEDVQRAKRRGRILREEI